MPILDDNTTLTTFKNDSLCDMVSSAVAYLSKLREGENCKKDFCNLEKSHNLIKSLDFYTVPGTVTGIAVESEAIIDLSGLDGSLFANGMSITVSVTIDGTLYTLASFTGDYYELAPSVLIDDINDEINGGSSGFTSLVSGTNIYLTAPVNLGSIPNGASVSVFLAPRYVFTSACLAESGVDVGSPGWAGIGFKSSEGYIYAANSGGSKKAYWWNGTGSLATPPAPTGSLAQCTATGTNNEGVVFNPDSGGKLFIGSSAFSPPIVNNNPTSLGLTCAASLSPVLGYAKDMRPRVYSPVNGHVYCSGIGINIESINPFGVTTTLTTVNGGAFLYNINRAVVDPYTGYVWVLGVYSPATHYAFGIVRATDVTPTIDIVVTGTLATNLSPTHIVFVESLDQMAIFFETAGLIHYYDLTGVLVSSVAYTPGGGTLESICYDTTNDKILIGRSGTEVQVLNADGSANTTFIVDGAIAGSVSYMVEDGGNLYVAISQVALSKLYLAKMSYVTLGNSYPGTFTGGITGYTITTDDNCMSESSAQKVVDKIKTLGALCNDCDDLVEDVIIPHNAFGALTGEGTYLVDDSGNYIVDENNNYIIVG